MSKTLVTLTVLTTTYDRSHLLRRCFESLMNQSDKDFEWLIVDDGSSDGTEELINQMMGTAQFLIVYLHKANGGKHTALNQGIKEIKSELTVILDSDDCLTPDAVLTIKSVWNMYKQNPKLCGLSFLKADFQDKIIGDSFPQGIFLSNHIHCRFNIGVRGDKFEVFRSDILKEYPFPEFAGEKFMGEGLVWNRIARKYNTLYLNKVLYLAEYQSDGMSKSGRINNIKCPQGSMLTARECFSKEFHLKVRLKYFILYICYGLFAKKNLKFMLQDSGNKFLFLLTLIPGYLLHKYWRYKYLIRGK